MTYADAISRGFAKTFTKNGRATRSEYWYFICTFWAAFWATVAAVVLKWTEIQALLALATVILFVPTLTLTVRRLHDTGRSGWWMLVWVGVWGLGIAIIFVFALLRSDPGDNRYGPPAVYRDPSSDGPSLSRRLYRAMIDRPLGALRRWGRKLSRAGRRWATKRIAGSELVDVANGGAGPSQGCTILIHGTFARDATWTLAGEPIAEAIGTAIPGHAIRRFIWSGGNSHLARLNAARQLRDEIASLKAAGEQPVHLVGHSHGGTVALLALRDPETQHAVDRAVFLGTPFLHTRPRALELLCRNLANSLSWFIAFPGLFIPLFAFMGIVIGVSTAFEQTDMLNYTMVGLIGAGAIITFLGLAFYLIERPKVRTEIDRSLQRFFGTYQRATAVFLSQPTPPCPVFIARINRDEARIWLRLVTGLADLPWQLISLAHRALAAILITGLAAFVALAFLSSALGLPDQLTMITAMIAAGSGIALAFALLFAPLIFSLYLWLVRGTRFGVGTAGLIEGLAADIRIGSDLSPPIAPGSRTVNLSHAKDGLRHSSFYSDSALAQSVAEWLAQPLPAAPEIADAAIHRERAQSVAPPPRSHVAALALPLAIAVLMAGGIGFGYSRALNRLPVEISDLDPPVSSLAEFEPTRFDAERHRVSADADTFASFIDLSEVQGATCELEGTFSSSDWASQVSFEQASVEEIDPGQASNYPDDQVVQSDGTAWHILFDQPVYSTPTGNARRVLFRKSFEVMGDKLFYEVSTKSAKPADTELSMSLRCG